MEKITCHKAYEYPQRNFEHPFRIASFITSLETLQNLTKPKAPATAKVYFESDGSTQTVHWNKAKWRWHWLVFKFITPFICYSPLLYYHFNKNICSVCVILLPKEIKLFLSPQTSLMLRNTMVHFLSQKAGILGQINDRWFDLVEMWCVRVHTFGNKVECGVKSHYDCWGSSIDMRVLRWGLGITSIEVFWIWGIYFSRKKKKLFFVI